MLQKTFTIAEHQFVRHSKQTNKTDHCTVKLNTKTKLYYMLLLLDETRGPTCFDDLKQCVRVVYFRLINLPVEFWGFWRIKLFGGWDRTEVHCRLALQLLFV